MKQLCIITRLLEKLPKRPEKLHLFSQLSVGWISQLGEFVFSVPSKWRYDIFTEHCEKTVEINQVGALCFHFLLASFVLTPRLQEYEAKVTVLYLDKFQGFSFFTDTGEDYNVYK